MPLAPPRDEEVEAILRRIVRRVAKALVGYGEDLESGFDALAALQAAEVDRRLRYPDPLPYQRRSAMADGFSLHAGVRIHENDRPGLERLCRYPLLLYVFVMEPLVAWWFGEGGRWHREFSLPRFWGG